MTPAVKLLQKRDISFELHTYTHDADAPSYGLEAAEKLAIAPEQVFKTLIVALETKQLAVAVVPVNRQLNLKAFAKAAKSKRAVMAPTADAERATGYVVGGISPLGQKKRLALVLDKSAESLQTIYISAGKRGLEIELTPSDLLLLTGGSVAGIAVDN